MYTGDIENPKPVQVLVSFLILFHQDQIKIKLAPRFEVAQINGCHFEYLLNAVV